VNYWIFKCSVKRYRLFQRLQDKEPRTTWQITRYKKLIEADDIAFIMKTRPKRAIYAIIRIVSKPCEMPEYPHEEAYCIDLDTGLRCRVEAIYRKRILEGLPEELLFQTKGLKEISAFQRPRGTNFILTPEEGKSIMGLIKARESKKLKTQVKANAR
jgi:hypothetical protein